MQLRDLVEVKYKNDLGALEHELTHFTPMKKHKKMIERASEIEDAAIALERKVSNFDELIKSLDKKIEELKTAGVPVGKPARAKFGTGKKEDGSPASAAAKKSTIVRRPRQDKSLNDSASKQSVISISAIKDKELDKTPKSKEVILEIPKISEEKKV